MTGYRAVFLDRDGTINEEVGYLSDPAHIALIPGAAEALIRLNSAGFKLVVVSNQSGIARGYFSEDDLAAVNGELDRQLVLAGVTIDGYYHCPHHPLHGKGVDCDCRKPGTGMAVRAAAEHGIDISRSYFVGDKASDIELGLNSGGKSVLVLTGYGREARKVLEEKGLAPDMIVPGLSEAAGWILQDSKES